MIPPVVFSPDPQPLPFWVIYLAGVLVIISIRCGYVPRSRSSATPIDVQIGDHVATSLHVSGVVIGISGECVTLRLKGHPDGRNIMVVHSSAIVAVLPPR
jgi:hypothetical protein